jgi:poly(A) polymerase
LNAILDIHFHSFEDHGTMSTRDKSLEPSRPLEWNSPLSTQVSTDTENEISDYLLQYLDKNTPIADESDIRNRNNAILEILSIFQLWIRECCVSKGFYKDVDDASEVGGTVFVSGSFRLGVTTPDGDVDCICIAPRFVDRVDFFDTFAPKLKKHPQISEILPIPGAKVPIIELVYDGISIDLLFSSLPLSKVPHDINILDDEILHGLDEASTITLNGPRVTELIFRAVPNPDVFRIVLRTLREWAKARGLYSNKMGFLGGVNFAILAAYICQLYPNLSAAATVHKFFLLFKSWKWPSPVKLTKPYTTHLGLPVWDPLVDIRSRRDIMPIITPAYPCSNSSYNVCKTTLSIMMEEISRGYDICEKILNASERSVESWSDLFKSSEFFLRFDHYLVFEVSAANEEDLMAWKGFVESRVRKFVEFLEFERLPLVYVQPYPKAFERIEIIPPQPPESEPPADVGVSEPSTSPIEEKSDVETVKNTESNSKEIEANKKSIESIPTSSKIYCYYVGIAPDKEKLKGSSLILSPVLKHFKSTALMNWPNRKEGMLVKQKVLPWSSLPEDLFPSGKSVAATERIAYRNIVVNLNVSEESSQLSKTVPDVPMSDGGLQTSGVKRPLDEVASGDASATASSLDADSRSKRLVPSLAPVVPVIVPIAKKMKVSLLAKK